MTDALYLRYRPQTFEDVVGQKHVADTLRNAMRQDRVGHAYLFTGPRGTGKTSTARILAKAVNCLAQDVNARPDNACAICTAINQGRLMDLIEIDAASNTSVDDMRALIEKIAFAPSEARYKVYVIDEVHMLSTSAFNALLKTLEEPPAHVIFILATTEPHKIPATILSRCQRFDFHRISTQQISQHLGKIAEQEGLGISAEALGIIGRSATGSMRDAISLLDQVASYGHTQISEELVRDILGMVSGLAISDFIDALAAGDPAIVLTKLHDLINKGIELSQFITQLIDHLRTLLLLNVGKNASLVDLPDSLLARAQIQAEKFTAPQLLHTIRALTEAGQTLKTPFAGYLPIELALLDALNIGKTASVSAPPAHPAPAPASRTPAPAPASGHRHQTTTRRPAATTAVTKAPSRRTTSTEPPSTGVTEPVSGELGDIWKQLLRTLRRSDPRLQALLRSGAPTHLQNDELHIHLHHDFHRQQVQAKIDTLNKTLSDLMGRPMRAIILEEENGQKKTITAKTPKPDPASPPKPSTAASTPPPTIENHPLTQHALQKWGGKLDTP